MLALITFANGCQVQRFFMPCINYPVRVPRQTVRRAIEQVAKRAREMERGSELATLLGFHEAVRAATKCSATIKRWPRLMLCH